MIIINGKERTFEEFWQEYKHRKYVSSKELEYDNPDLDDSGEDYGL